MSTVSRREDPVLRALVFLAAIALGLYLAFDGASGDSRGSGVRATDASHPEADRADGPVLAGRAAAAPDSRAGGSVPEQAAAVAEEQVEEVQALPPDEERAAREREEAELQRQEHVRDLAQGADPYSPAWVRPRPPAPGQTGRVMGETDCVLPALRWLAAHQSIDGHFGAADFGRWCEGHGHVKDGPDGAGRAEHDVGATALALCAFLGAGYTYRGEHEFHWVVLRGLKWLRARQDAEGVVRTGSHDTWAWDHACATLALVETYGLTESPVWREPAQRALTALERLRLPAGVWRYGLRSDLGDFSLTFWAAFPLVSARIINADGEKRGKPPHFVVDAAAFESVQHWIAGLADPETGTFGNGVDANASPALPGSSPRALTALATLVRLWRRASGETDPSLARAVATVAAAAPATGEPPETVDMVQRWAGTLATFTHGKKPWQTWEKGLDAEVGPRQHMDGDYCALRGSWDPVGAWASEGGRVVMTSLMCLSFEVLYRYDHAPLAR